jgi:hypothetical protein
MAAVDIVIQTAAPMILENSWCCLQVCRRVAEMPVMFFDPLLFAERTKLV